MITSVIMTSSIIGLASREILIKGITTSASSVGRGVSYLLSSSSKVSGVNDIKNILIAEDIAVRVKIADCLSKQLNNKIDDLNEPTQLALKSVIEVLESIEIELLCINNKIINAEKPKWYFWKKGGNFYNNVENIKLLMERFNKRLDVLIKLLTIDI
jgi:hypothetical protein